MVWMNWAVFSWAVGAVMGELLEAPSLRGV